MSHPVLRWRSALLIASLCAVLPLRAENPSSPDPEAQPSQAAPVQSPAQMASPATVAPHNDATAPVAQPLPETPKAPDVKAPDAGAAQADPAAQNPLVMLINALTKQGSITPDQSKAILQAAQQQQSAAPQGGATPDGAMDVSYVPGPVKDQLREEIKSDVMTQAREENWADPRQFPDWLSRISLFGDFRFRYEGDFFPQGNIPGSLVNFNAINTGSPYDISKTAPAPRLPLYNVDQDRERLRVRARFGLGADLGDGFSAGFRVASGADDSPVTENQSLGSDSGQGGNFSKYAVWIDRAFLKYEMGGGPTDDYGASATIGRFDNPFFHTSMTWADDLGFDGFALQGKYKVAEGITPFFNGGVFPIFNTDLNFGTNSTADGSGYSSEDKWLYGIQIGSDFKINDDFNLKIAGAFYDFQNVEGKVSTPYLSSVIANNSSFQGDTDNSRPGFAQNGNTYIPLRDIVQDPSTPTYDPQYYGLATPFRVAAATGRLDFNRFDPFHIALVGEFLDNVAFDRGAILNNGPTFGGSVPTGPQNNLGDGGTFNGGNIGWLVQLQLGHTALEKRWDWNVNVGYRYVESDAMVDGFTDSDFGGFLTGTNLKGYTVGGNVALSKNVWTGLRFMSADTIAGAPMKDDTLQFDINAKF